MKPKIETYGKRKDVRKNLIFLMISLAIIILAFLSFFLGINYSSTGNNINDLKNYSFSSEERIENFEEILSEDTLIKNLPSNVHISLYIGDEKYSISKNSVIKGDTKNKDLEIFITPDYKLALTRDLCESIKLASKRGDFDLKLISSKTELIWKLRSMIKYKSCLGLN